MGMKAIKIEPDGDIREVEITGLQPGPDGDEFCDVPEHIVAAAMELAGLWKEARA